MRWPLLLMPLLALVVGACSPVKALNALAPDAGITVRDGIAYGSDPRQRLDVYSPTTAMAPLHAIVVFFYGGNWDSGDRAMYRFVGANLAAQGVVVVIPDYRLYPEVKFPGFMQDAARAVAWAHDHAVKIGGDPSRLFVMGHSAGAQIATLLALDGEYLRAVGREPRDIAGVIGLAGPYDFLPLHDPTLKAIFGPPAAWPRSQPIRFVRPGAPPMLLLAGNDDDTVDPGNSRRLAAALRQAGDTVQLIIYPSIGHKELIGALARPLTFLAPVRHDVLAFIGAHSEVNAPGDVKACE